MSRKDAEAMARKLLDIADRIDASAAVDEAAVAQNREAGDHGMASWYGGRANGLRWAARKVRALGKTTTD
jgi:hypothetical protein